MKLVSFIGSGNVAWHLAPALDNTDFAVREVYSVKTSLDFSGSTSNIFIIAVPDDVIQSIVQEIILPDNAILVHTSGSQPLAALGYAAIPSTGVFYPLQTFSKSKKVDFTDVPIFVESEDAVTEKLLLSMAKAISKNVHQITSQERKAMHVAAVFAANFTNHMLLIAQQIMKENNLNFEWLKPLVAEMINKSISIGPENSQTGPARRGDFEILDRHMEFLQGDEQRAEIYKVISQHIIDRYHG
jgi:predicted short-subunit dehydrogenase-like oxidoreductase (DUF2520 family)